MHDYDEENKMQDDTQSSWHSKDKAKHIVHLPQLIPFTVPHGYDYLRRGKVRSSIYFIFRQAADIILTLYNSLVFGLRIRGRKNLRNVNGAVVVCNHVHILDCTFIDTVFPFKRMYYVTLESNFRIPIARHLIRLFGGIPIPSGIRELKEFYAAVAQAIENGSYVCIYPEGILHPYYPTLRDFNDGAFKIAASAGCPVLPLAITFRKARGLKRIFKRKPTVTLNILPAVYPGEADADCTAAEKENGRRLVRIRAEYLRKKCKEEMEEAICQR